MTGYVLMYYYNLLSYFFLVLVLTFFNFRLIEKVNLNASKINLFKHFKISDFIKSP